MAAIEFAGIDYFAWDASVRRLAILFGEASAARERGDAEGVAQVESAANALLHDLYAMRGRGLFADETEACEPEGEALLVGPPTSAKVS